MKKYFKIVLLMAIACGGLFFYKTNDKKIEFVTAKLNHGKISQTVTASGVINPLSTVIVGTQVSGTIKEIYVDYNSEVKQDQLLALIDPDIFEATVAQRQAALEIAQAQVNVQENDIIYYKKHLDRISKLKNASYSTEKEMEEAERNYNNALAQLKLQQAQVKQAQAALDSAQTELRYTKITSPVDGIVISKSVEVGQTVAASFETPVLFNVAEDLTKMQIEASVVEADIAKVHEGQKVEFSVDSFPDEIFHGVVTQVRNNPITTSNVVTYEVIIGVDNKDLKIKPGMTANVEIITAEKKDALVVSNKALRFYTFDEKGDVVRYKDKGIWLLKDGNLVRVNIEQGVFDDEMSEIISEDINVGDEVVLEDKKASEKQRTMRMRMPR